MCEISSELTTKTPNKVTDVVLMSLVVLLTDFKHCSGISITDFERVNIDWVPTFHNY